jgi:hypothetical protein
MSYVIYKSNGEQLTIVNDGSINQTTDLTLVGRNYPSYGQILDQNFIKLLENFAGPKTPSKSLAGQLWYDTSNKKLKVFVGSAYRSIPRLEIANEAPIVSSGDFWWDESSKQLKYYDGSSYLTIGPQFVGIDGLNSLIPEKVFDINGVPHYVLKHQILNLVSGNPEIVAVTSVDEFQIDTGVIDGFIKIKRGINFGTDSTVNVEDNKVILTVDALGAGKVSTAATRLGFHTTTTASVEVNVLNLYATPTKNYIYPGTTATVTDLGSTQFPFGTVYAESTSAQYADLAERYQADAHYAPGTVLRIGGTAEVTICNRYEDEQVAGIVSTAPAYTMNDGMPETDKTPYIALKGRVPCKVKGPVKKGQILVTSDFPGHAEVRRTHQRPNELGVVGKALQDFDGEYGVIEVMVI